MQQAKNDAKFDILSVVFSYVHRLVVESFSYVAFSFQTKIFNFVFIITEILEGKFP